MPKLKLEFEIDNIKGYKWLFFGKGSRIVEDDNIDEAAKELQASPELLEAINNALEFLAETVVNATKADLKDMWDKIEKLEKERI